MTGRKEVLTEKHEDSFVKKMSLFLNTLLLRFQQDSRQLEILGKSLGIQYSELVILICGPHRTSSGWISTKSKEMGSKVVSKKFVSMWLIYNQRSWAIIQGLLDAPLISKKKKKKLQIFDVARSASSIQRNENPQEHSVNI